MTQQTIKGKKDVILPSLYDFFKDKERLNIMIPIISGYSELSIRVLDWFVTNYAKKKMTVYTLDDGSHFNVYTNYKSQLKGYKKKLFDPFCRKKRIPFYYGDNKCIITTIGQLNFFKWAISNNIIQYVRDNIDEITQDMNTVHSSDTQNTVSSDNKVNIHKIFLDFDS
jgi:hypothetical protein